MNDDSFLDLPTSPSLAQQGTDHDQPPSISLDMPALQLWRHATGTVFFKGFFNNDDERRAFAGIMEQAKMSANALSMLPQHDRASAVVYQSCGLPLGLAIAAASFASHLFDNSSSATTTTAASSSSSSTTSSSVSSTTTTTTTTTTKNKKKKDASAEHFRDIEINSSGLPIVGLTDNGRSSLLQIADMCERVACYFRSLELRGAPTMHAVIMRLFLMCGPFPLYKPTNFLARMLRIVAELVGARELAELAASGVDPSGLLDFTAVVNFICMAQQSVRSNQLQFATNRKTLVGEAMSDHAFPGLVRRSIADANSELASLNVDDLFEVVVIDGVEYLDAKKDLGAERGRLLCTAARAVGFKLVELTTTKKQCDQTVISCKPYAIDLSHLSPEEFGRSSATLPLDARRYVVVPPEQVLYLNVARGAQILGLEFLARQMLVPRSERAVQPAAARASASANANHNDQRKPSGVVATLERALTVPYLECYAESFRLHNKEAMLAFDCEASAELKKLEIDQDRQRMRATMPQSFTQVAQAPKRRKQGGANADVQLFGAAFGQALQESVKSSSIDTDTHNE
jgi:hypothetical protein